MKSSIQTGDPLQVTAGAVPFDELEDKYIWLPAPVSVRAALEFLAPACAGQAGSG